MNNQLVARFYYKGTHSHPVRRTVVVLEENNNVITGYELREGKIIRNLFDSPVKSYRKNKISKYGDYCRLKMNNKNYKMNDGESTLQRESLYELVNNGV